MDIQKGDLICLGDHLLLCGDSTKPEETRTLLKENKINLILTDPPYGVAYVESKKGFTQELGKSKEIVNDHIQTETEYRSFTSAWMSQARNSMAKKNSVYIFNSDKMLFALREGMDQVGCRFTQLLIWAKTTAVIGRMDYLPQHELIAYGWFGTHKFHKSKDKSVLVYPKPNKSKRHPTMKPVGLLRRLILNSSKTGDVVYDPFGGSGSTLLACEQTKRKCLMIELDVDYCKGIVEDWEQMTGNSAMKMDVCRTE
ncbi:MAG: site-specific DNA-methyltransferase [Candidatus Uhrbacteria bacterium]|nr:site-specific DNA-methyltransferase [Patescibacteria group bacterium]MBU1907234.1 site-specific DNA-methyltransferase [Patescibacteria group bacterium]